MNSELHLLERDPELFPEPLKRVLDLITINETPTVVGSSAYLVHKYPSDVDVFEKVTVDLTKEEAAAFYWDQFKNIIQKLVVDSNDLFITDFKVGEDTRYAEGVTIEDLQRENLLTKRISELAGTPYFKEALRQQRTLRWSPEEVLRGFKKLPGKRITFVEAVSQPAIVKLDVATWISGRFQSVEVFYNLGYKEADFFPLGSYTESLLEDIEKYSSPEYYSPLKMAKRLWSLSRVTECQDLLQALNPLLGSDVAALNQINSDIETLNQIMRGSLPIYQVTRIFLEVLGFHKRITNHLKGESYLKIHLSIDRIFAYWVEWQRTSRLPAKEILEILREVSILLKSEIQVRSREFLERVEEMNIKCANPRFQN